MKQTQIRKPKSRPKAQRGGFFAHLGLGKDGSWSGGTTLARVGGQLIAAALVALSAGLVRAA